MTDGYQLFMSAPHPYNNKPTRRKRWAGVLVLLLLLLAILAALWWWNKNQVEAINRLQQEQLAFAQERQRKLAETLAAIPPVNPETCPPGQVLRPIDEAPTALEVHRAALTLPNDVVPLLKSAELTERLERSTAMVLAKNSKGLSTGSGFFISPNLFVTNHHVIQGGQGDILLASHALKSPRRASVLLTTQGIEAGTPDFALLRLEDGTAPGYLPTSTFLRKLESVVAAGFPGVVVENDPKFARLLAGDSSSAPDLSLTQGAIQSLQTGANNVPLIIHTAPIAKGNSGGPLIDLCGRLIGINTFINVDKTQSSKVSYALSTNTMMAFLKDANVKVADDARGCAVS